VGSWGDEGTQSRGKGRWPSDGIEEKEEGGEGCWGGADGARERERRGVK